jgi:hypothetical protein
MDNVAETITGNAAITHGVLRNHESSHHQNPTPTIPIPPVILSLPLNRKIPNP